MLHLQRPVRPGTALANNPCGPKVAQRAEMYLCCLFLCGPNLFNQLCSVSPALPSQGMTEDRDVIILSVRQDLSVGEDRA